MRTKAQSRPWLKAKLGCDFPQGEAEQAPELQDQGRCPGSARRSGGLFQRPSTQNREGRSRRDSAETRGIGSSDRRARPACRGGSERSPCPAERDGPRGAPGSVRRGTARAGRGGPEGPPGPAAGLSPPRPAADAGTRTHRDAPGRTADAPRPPFPGRGAARGVRQGGAPQAGREERERRLTQKGKGSGAGGAPSVPPRTPSGPPEEPPGSPGLTCAALRAGGGRRARAGRSRGCARVRERRAIDGAAAPPPAGGAG